MSMKIPLYNRAGNVIDHAIVDEQDADLAGMRWHRGNGYARSGGPATRVSMHVLILERMGHPAGTYAMGDHINRDRTDNRRSNLRPATAALNAQNRTISPRAGRPRTLPDAEPRDCATCATTFTPRRKSPDATYCSRHCQRVHQARTNAPAALAARWSKP